MSKSDEYMSIRLFSITIDPYVYPDTDVIKDRKIQNGFSWSSFLLNLKKDMHLQVNIYQQYPHEFLPLHRYFFFFRTWFKLWNDFDILHHIELSVSFRSSMNL